MPKKGDKGAERLTDDDEVQSPPRIISGKWRNSRLAYSGDIRTRPMKERVRESVFSLLRGEEVGRVAIDLFAGTGALGFEALSRGARSALFLEQHFPTAALIRQNALNLQALDQCQIEANDTFYWTRKLRPSCPMLQGDGSWCLFCSPPYEFFHTRSEEMRAMLILWIQAAPSGSLFVVESNVDFPLRAWLASINESFDEDRRLHWDIRDYPPACTAIGRLPN